MMIHTYLLDILNLLPRQGERFITISNNEATLIINNHELFKITPEVLSLIGVISLDQKLQAVTQVRKNTLLGIEKLAQFFHEIKTSCVRLNHIGVSYFCTDIQKEINEYREVLKNSSFKLYEEESGDANQQWFFVGNTNDWHASLVEIILNKLPSPEYVKWAPHVQVDIDTTLSMKELESLAKQYCGNDFWKWRINIPHVGVVLAMANLGEVDGIKITLCFGTSLRDTRYQRQHLLKEI